MASISLRLGLEPLLQYEARLDGRELRRGIRLTRPVAEAAPERRPAVGWARIRRLPSDSLDSAALHHPVTARETPNGRYALSLPVGARLPMTSRTPDAVRLQLSRDLQVWVSARDADTLASPRRDLTLGPADSAQTAGTIRISVPAPEPLASTVELTRTGLRWSIFAARTQSASVALRLAAPPLGWKTRWADDTLTLQVRPARRHSALTGLVVALDAGHPPGGAIGPTGLREDSVTLAVAQEAAQRLLEAGARPVLLRADARPVSLAARTAVAESADAHVYVSIHVDAPAPHEAPWDADGVRTFYHHRSSAPLAEALHESVATIMGQPRRGVRHSNLVVLRSAWFPAVLVEGTCLALPEREALLRTRRGIEAYAEGIVRGLGRWASRPPCPDQAACG